MHLIQIITLALFITTTLTEIFKVINYISTERKMVKQGEPSFADYTYLYVIAPQVSFIIGAVLLFWVSPIFMYGSVTILGVFINTLVVYFVYILFTGLGNLLVALVESRGK